MSPEPVLGVGEQDVPCDDALAVVVAGRAQTGVQVQCEAVLEVLCGDGKRVETPGVSTSGVFKGYATMPWHTPLASEAPLAG